MRVDGEIHDLSEEFKLAKTKKHNIEIVVDRVVIRPDARGRITDSVETASALSGGLVIADVIGGEPITFSQNYACDDCGISIEELTPRMFSFNNPYGACPVCTGLGIQKRVDPDRVIPNRHLSIKQGAIRASGWGTPTRAASQQCTTTHSAKSTALRWKRLSRSSPSRRIDELLYGTGDEPLELSVSRISGGVMRQPFEGIIPNLERRYRETNSEWSRGEIEEVMSESPCPACHGRRLRPEVLAVTLGGLNIAEFAEKSVVKAMEFLHTLKLTEMQHKIGDRVIKEIMDRLGFLQSVGLEYLTLSRSSGTLSGGESQRIRLATQIGSSLMGVLYILDEPSIGLHQRDNDKLLATLGRLRDLGNTLIVVEHDEDTMFAADHIVDIGPGAGRNGGEVVFEGTIDELLKSDKSITGQYLSGKKFIPVPEIRRKGNGKSITVKGCAVNNLKHTDFTIPLGTLTCVTGVSGSGKSSFVNEILYKKLAAELNGAKTRAGAHDEFIGIENLDKVIDIDQSPIGRTPRSNPATYTGCSTTSANCLQRRRMPRRAATARAVSHSMSRAADAKPARVTACSKLKCTFCRMCMFPVTCARAAATTRKRSRCATRAKNIYEVLDMTVDEACEFFANVPKIARRLETMREVGLGYVKLGQSSTTLSGGEAQRAKLATELSKRSTGKTIYILDEPTTGLHVADVHRLVDVLQKLVDAGNTVVVIEHNLDVIKTADYILDLGPEGGDGGGRLVVSGTPEEVAQCKGSYTGQYLGPILARKNGGKREQ